MKPLFFSLLLFISLPGWAQTENRTEGIRQQLEGLWEIDTPSTTFSAQRDGFPWVQFLSGDRVAIVDGECKILSYSIAFSISDTFLIFPEFSQKLKSKWTGKEWLISEIYFLGILYPDEKLVKKDSVKSLPLALASAYALDKSEFGWTIYPPLSAMPDNSVVLNENHTFSWDRIGTGSWKLDSVKGILQFQTDANILTYEITALGLYHLVLRPYQIMHPDSLLSYTPITEFTSYIEISPLYDSIRNVDSLFVVAVAQAEEFLIDLQSDPLIFGKKLNGSWKATRVSTPESNPYSFVWDENGSLLIRSGKKEKKYTWELMTQEEHFVKLKLTHSGKEELCILQFYVDYVHHQITLINPFTGKLESFLLQRSE